MHKIPMTPEGKKKMEARLKHLKAVERPKIIMAIEEARGHGDLSENAEYHAAKEAQAHLSRELREIEDKLARAQVIDPSQFNHSKVTFGASVTLEDAETGEEKTYQIVGPDESDVKAGKISVVSPIAKALIGKEKGDVVTVSTPKGPKELAILSVRFN
ncbi:MAG: transcription elongation factor GreA [Deltaproteobacteria bacterium]|nr:transcription elongation factor GreA [Deltaproteobacteria bacterium]MBI4224116.1 transcription elongation factor GreA [Deltaproteobacteria bacterium]